MKVGVTPRCVRQPSDHKYFPGIFAKDDDWDVCSRIASEIKIRPRWRVSPTDNAWVEYFQRGSATANHPEIDAAAVCRHLDGGLGDKLFDYYRGSWNGSNENSTWRHREIIFGAMMMRVGAKIRGIDLEHLRSLSERPDVHDFLLPKGQLEFQAALDAHRAGTPREFGVPSCEHCGKTSADTGSHLDRCKKCRRTSPNCDRWICSEVCIPRVLEYLLRDEPLTLQVSLELPPVSYTVAHTRVQRLDSR